MDSLNQSVQVRIAIRIARKSADDEPPDDAPPIGKTMGGGIHVFPNKPVPTHDSLSGYTGSSASVCGGDSVNTLGLRDDGKRTISGNTE